MHTLLFLAVLSAHPIEEKVYDRTISVRLTPGAVLVEYHLEVNARTAYADVPDLVSKEALAEITRADQVYHAFLNGRAPHLAKTLYATLDGKELTFVCKARRFRVFDHLRCEYRFEAVWKPAPGGRHRFRFREPNFEDDKGSIRLTLTAAGVKLLSRKQPDEALWQRKPLDLAPGDRDRLRTVEAVIALTRGKRQETKTTAESPELPRQEPARKRSLEELILHSGLGFGTLLLVVAFAGAAHALTPGHGKTLVAAYLVGEKGTTGHALLLGLVTTLTHTGAVLLLAGVFPRLVPAASLQSIHGTLTFVGGLLIAAVGFWLLLRRLAGQADHFHFGDGHHAHPDRPVTLGSLIVLGIAGGIVPCWDAVAIFGACIKWQRPDLALPLLLAFSAGLAAVLVALGLGVVWSQRFSSAVGADNPRWQRFVRLLPLVSAVLVTALGLWMCYDGAQALPR